MCPPGTLKAHYPARIAHCAKRLTTRVALCLPAPFPWLPSFPRPQRDSNMSVAEVRQQVEYVALVTKQASSVSDLRNFAFAAPSIRVRR